MTRIIEESELARLLDEAKNAEPVQAYEKRINAIATEYYEIEPFEMPTGAAEAGPQEQCPYCDGSGDVHSADGEWRGVCTCEAGRAIERRVQEGK